MGILRVRDLNKGMAIKQGDKTVLKFGLYDSDEDTLTLANQGKVYFKRGKNVYSEFDVTVDTENVASFTLNRIIPPGSYHLEFIVSDRIFPSEDKELFKVTSSVLGEEIQVIEFHGIKKVVEQTLGLIQPRIDQAIGNLESFYDELIDEGIMETNIQNRLNQLELDYAPQLTKVGEEIERAKKQTGSKISQKARRKRNFVTIFSDDARRADYDVLKPILDRHGVKMGLGVITQYIGTGTHLTMAELQQLQSEGHEINSHSHSHGTLTGMTEEQIDFELKTSAEILRENGLKGETFIVPFGAYDERVKRLATKYYRAMRTSEPVPFEWNHNKIPFETYALKGIWISNSETVDTVSGYAPNEFGYYKYYIDKMVEDDNGWLIISTHGNDITGWGYEALFEQIVEYIADVATPVTLNQALDEMDNLIDDRNYNTRRPYDDHFSLGVDGVPVSNRIATKVLGLNAVSASTPIEEFEDGFISICNLNISGAVGMPGDLAGLLLTYKFLPKTNGLSYGEYYYCYQTYKAIHTNNIYYRRPTSLTEWSEWQQVAYVGGESGQNLIIEPRNTQNCLTPIQDFPVRVTYTPLSTVEAQKGGAPVSLGGTLVTHKVIANYEPGNQSYNRQTYDVYDSADRYYRYATSLTEWSPWRLIPPNLDTVTDQRTNSQLRFWTGDQSQFDAVTTKETNTLYFVI